MYICAKSPCLWAFRISQFVSAMNMAARCLDHVSLGHLSRVGCWVTASLCECRSSLRSPRLLPVVFCHQQNVLCVLSNPWFGQTAILAIRVGVKWQVSVILICTSLITGKACEHLAFLFCDLPVHFFCPSQTLGVGWGGVSLYWS